MFSAITRFLDWAEFFSHEAIITCSCIILFPLIHHAHNWIKDCVIDQCDVITVMNYFGTCYSTQHWKVFPAASVLWYFRVSLQSDQGEPVAGDCGTTQTTVTVGPCRGAGSATTCSQSQIFKATLVPLKWQYENAEWESVYLQSPISLWLKWFTITCHL